MDVIKLGPKCIALSSIAIVVVVGFSIRTLEAIHKIMSHYASKDQSLVTNCLRDFSLNALVRYHWEVSKTNRSVCDL